MTRYLKRLQYRYVQRLNDEALRRRLERISGLREERIAEIRERIGDAYDLLHNSEQAQLYYEQAAQGFESIGMDVANRNRQSVRCIERFRRRIQSQQSAYHLLNLKFFGPSIAGDGAFHLER